MIDTVENKDKLSLPMFDSTGISGYTKQYENYFNNHFPLKYNYINWYNRFKYKVAQSNTANDKVIAGKDNWLFYNACIFDSLGLNEYCGYKNWNEQQYQKALQNIKGIKKWCTLNHIEFVLMIVPNKQSAYPEYLPTIYKKEKNNRYDALYSQLPNDINLKHVFDGYKKNHKTALYYKTDTHWNVLGSALAIQEVTKKLQVKFPYITQFDNLVFSDSAIYEGKDLANMLALKQNYQDNAVLVSGFDQSKQKIPKLFILHDSFIESLYPYLNQLFDSVSEKGLFEFPSPEQLLKEKPDVFVIELVERYKEILTWDIHPDYLK
jgi:alginate O-acetyltransferase complex protein AlgJ